MSDFASFFPAGLTPSLTMATLDRHLGWALVLAAVITFLLQNVPRLVRHVAALAIFIAAIVPANWSLAYWLGLAYQTPSLVGQGLALIYLFRSFFMQAAKPNGTLAASAKWPLSILLAVTVLGWILALDTFAKLPVSLYALGYSEGVAFFGLVLAVVFWMQGRGGVGSADNWYFRCVAIVLLGSIAIHTFIRLPSGNAWDAMLDPWLWLIAQAILLVRLVKFVIARFKSGNRKVQGSEVGSPVMLKQ